MTTNNKQITLIPDIYDISSSVNNIQQEYMDGVSQDTLTMGIFGYQNFVFSDALQNSIIMATEWGNEAFPIRTKFVQNIMTNAVTYGVDNINAVPAQMEVMIGFIINEIKPFFTENYFTIYKDIPIKIGEFEYRLDYDIILNMDTTSGTLNYSARYDMTDTNPISTITNPYLQPPVILTLDDSLFVFITCTIRQVSIEQIEKKIVTDNLLENKTFDFNFTNQLAAFTIVAEENNKTTVLTPVYEGLPPTGIQNYCYYTYLDENTIRIKFTRESYNPKINAKISVVIQNTLGSDGNFTYKDNVIINMISTQYNYRGLSALMKPVNGSSTNGIDRKSISDIKAIIPKEILSRGNIINNKDLQNFFNSIDSDNKLYFFRQRDNQWTRLFYAYMLVKDSDDNIIPTNTIDMILTESDFDSVEDGRCLLNPGYIAEYQNWIGSKVDMSNSEALTAENSPSTFIYSSPFTMVVNKDPLCISYYLNEVNRIYDFKFVYINQQAPLQFISTNMEIYKNYLSQWKKDYKITLSAVQNMNVEKGMVTVDNAGNITSSKIKPVLVLENEGFKYYIFGNVVSYDKTSFRYEIEFILNTDNIISTDNKIKIENMYLGGTTTQSYVFFPSKINASVYMFAEFEGVDELGNAGDLIPSMKDYTLCNQYQTTVPLELFHNYSGVMKSGVTVQRDSAGNNTYTIKGIPVVKYSYLNDEERANEVIDYIQYRKAYIDTALNLIENTFSVDLKYFNTYGPSKMFNIGDVNPKPLNRVNLTLNFRVKKYINADKHIKEYIIQDIKNYIESLNGPLKTYLHMSNIVTDITNKYNTDIEFIEFVSINGYPTSEQYLYKTQTEVISVVPEFLNINLNEQMEPDINIVLV